MRHNHENVHGEGGPPHHHHRNACHEAGSFFQSVFRGGGGLTRGFLRPSILLLLAERPCHGYELMSRLEEFGLGPGAMDPSVLYRLLRMMEREGLAVSSLDDSGSGPARKVYSLTPEGREVLDMWGANIEGLTSFLDRFKERYQQLGAATTGAQG